MPCGPEDEAVTDEEYLEAIESAENEAYGFNRLLSYAHGQEYGITLVIKRLREAAGKLYADGHDDRAKVYRSMAQEIQDSDLLPEARKLSKEYYETQVKHTNKAELLREEMEDHKKSAHYLIISDGIKEPIGCTTGDDGKEDVLREEPDVTFQEVPETVICPVCKED